MTKKPKKMKVPRPPKKFRETRVDTNIPLPPKSGIHHRLRCFIHPEQVHVVIENEKDVKKRKNLGFWGKFKLRMYPSSTFLILMEYSNGTSKLFVLKSSNETFKHKGRMYYLRYEDALYNLTHGQYILRYHEDYATPIDREITKLKDEELVDGKPPSDEKRTAFWSVTSHNLKPLIKMEYVKALASAQEISKYLKLGLVIGLVTLCILGFVAMQTYRLAPLG
jgi:hypothetical protein